MEKLTFKLDQFEGPLDLLLHLIAKHKLNLYDIPIDLLLEQYLEQMEQIPFADLEAASDFFGDGVAPGIYEISYVTAQV